MACELDSPLGVTRVDKSTRENQVENKGSLENLDRNDIRDFRRDLNSRGRSSNLKKAWS